MSSVVSIVFDLDFEISALSFYVKCACRNKEEIVTSLSQLFNVGCFAQVRLGPLFRVF